MARAPLPIDAVLPDLLAALERAPCAVLEAPTGAGKTTRVPPALVDGGHGPLVMLEPRRLAARAAARWMARERGTPLGGEVGYQVRFDRRACAETAILVVTEGVLLARLQADPFLEGVGTLVFDEFHERTVEADLALALARRIQGEARDDLKLLVMSATLEGDALAAYLGGCPVVRSQGRLFPVEEVYLPREPREEEQEHLVRGARLALERQEGDLLLFLPGVGEIRRTRRALEPLERARDLDLRELYGELDPAAQDAALLKGPRRKVILATNVAETSVTVEGVTAVVDGGLARVLRHDPTVGLDRLEVTRISAASAEQRRGRAGREAPGLCVRLWSVAEQRALIPRELPAIRRVDLAASALELLVWGERDPSAFPWFEAPSPEALDRALRLLEQLGATDRDGRPSELGTLLSRLPMHPRLGRLLVEGHRRGVPGRAALAAALLAERDPFERVPRGGPRARVTDSDLLDRVQALEAFDERGTTGAGPTPLRRGAARFVLRARDQLLRLARSRLGEPGVAGDRDEALARALLAAFPDRLCRRRGPGEERGLMVGGRGVRLAPSSGVTEAELFLALDLDAGRGEAWVRLASAVEREWLGPTREVIVLEFDPERERVVGRRELRLGELAVEVREHSGGEALEIERLLVRAATERLERALDLGEPRVASLRERATWLAEVRPELGLPRLDEGAIAELLPALAAGRRSFAELRRAPLLAALEGLFDHRQRAALEREAPERLTVPSGSSLRLTYEPGRPPVLAVRIQELFGLEQTPTVAGGAVSVLLHLLAPNGRPQQVTDDLPSFWRNTYPVVRKELRGRYPKHAWPEDPLAARPERRPGVRPE